MDCIKLNDMKKIILLLLFLVPVLCIAQANDSAFYKKEIDPAGRYITWPQTSDTNHYSILFAPNGVSAPGWKLKKIERKTYKYDKYGWYWSNTRDSALIILELKLADPADTLNLELN
jgi:hypothetical protein